MGFKVDDLVWAKIKGFPSWPAKIAEPNSTIKAPKNISAYEFVSFFGTGEVAWIMDKNLIPHNEAMFDKISKKRSKLYQRAINELMNYPETAVKQKQSSPKIKEKVEKKEVKNNVEKINAAKVKDGVGVKDVVEEKDAVDDGENIVTVKNTVKNSVKDKDTVEVAENTVDDKVRGENRKSVENVRKTKVVKIIKTVPKKHQRNVLTHKSPLKQVPKKKTIANGKNLFPAEVLRRLVERDEYLVNCIQSTSSTIGATKIPSVCVNKFGFIGIDDNFGKAVLKKMLECGMNVTLWDENLDRCVEFIEMVKGAKLADSPAELIVNCDITFSCCDTDTDYFENIIFGEDGILKGFEKAATLGQKNSKGYVGLTSIKYEMSVQINETISLKNGFYLEAPLVGTTENATEGKLIAVASGNRNLFTNCEQFFQNITKVSIFVNCDVGSSSKMSVVLNTISGVVDAAMAEAVELSQRLNIYQKDIRNVVKTLFSNDNINDKVLRMSMRRYMEPVTPLKHVQKDMSFALNLANTISLSMPVTSAANEVYKHAKLLKYSKSDVTSIYKIIKY